MSIYLCKLVFGGHFIRPNTFRTSLILAHSDQLAQSPQFYFLISSFNQKSKSVKMCEKLFYIFLYF